MNRIKLTLKENWKDPVWSKVIATGIITILGFLLTALYSLALTLIDKIPIKESFSKTWNILNQNTSIKVWFIVILFFLYLILIFKPLISVIKEIGIKFKKTKKKEKIEPELHQATEHSTVLFSYRIPGAFPGIRDITWFENPIEAVKRLEILLAKPLRFKSGTHEYESDPIWWFRGGSAMFIKKFKKIGRKKVIMNSKQLKIKKIAVYHGDSYYKDFVYVEVEGEKQSGLYNLKPDDIKRQIESFGYCSEEYGIIKNWFGWKIPIKREDYDDGATVIRGNVRSAINAELKTKYLSKYNFIIAAKGSPYNSTKFCRESKYYLDGILKGEVETESFFEFLKTFNKHEQ
jgi:hypothetical protein